MNERVRLATAALLVAALAAAFWYVTSLPGTSGAYLSEGEIEAAIEALDAWASFAETGDIERVGDWFVVDGPQYAQLQTEVEAIVSGGEYDFSLSAAHVVEPGVVRGSVTVSGQGQESQRYLWDIELVRREGGWKVWTVRTRPEN